MRDNSCDSTTSSHKSCNKRRHTITRAITSVVTLSSQHCHGNHNSFGPSHCTGRTAEGLAPRADFGPPVDGSMGGKRCRSLNVMCPAVEGCSAGLPATLVVEGTGGPRADLEPEAASRVLLSGVRRYPVCVCMWACAYVSSAHKATRKRGERVCVLVCACLCGCVLTVYCVC